MSNMMADFVYYRFFVGIEGLCFVSSLVVPGVLLVARPERYPVFKKAIDKPISDHEFWVRGTPCSPINSFSKIYAL